jgi:hypothetical protein
VSIDGAAARLFKSAKIDPNDWKGKGVRVRGYVGWRFGPEIEVSNPEQIELMAPLPPHGAGEVSDNGDE